MLFTLGETGTVSFSLSFSLPEALPLFPALPSFSFTTFSFATGEDSVLANEELDFDFGSDIPDSSTATGEIETEDFSDTLSDPPLLSAFSLLSGFSTTPLSLSFPDFPSAADLSAFPAFPPLISLTTSLVSNCSSSTLLDKDEEDDDKGREKGDGDAVRGLAESKANDEDEESGGLTEAAGGRRSPPGEVTDFIEEKTGLAGAEVLSPLMDGHDGTRGVEEPPPFPTLIPSLGVPTVAVFAAATALLRWIDTEISWTKTGGGSTGSPAGRFPVPLGPPLPVTRIWSRPGTCDNLL